MINMISLFALCILIYTRNVDGATYGLEIDANLGDGFEISSNERAMKIDLGASTADTMYIRDGKYICYNYCTSSLFSTSCKECCVEWDGTYYSSGWGADDTAGRAAKFDCNGGEDTVYSDLFAISSATSGSKAIYTYASFPYRYCLAAGSYKTYSHSLASDEINVYWRRNPSNGDCLEFAFSGGKLTTYYNGKAYGLEWDGNKGDGFEISSNERVIKLDEGASTADPMYIVDGKYICAAASKEECCLEWDGDLYYSGWGSENAGGRAAKFDCSGGRDSVFSDLFDSTPDDKAIYTTASGVTYCLSVGSMEGKSHSQNIYGGEKNIYWRRTGSGGCLEFSYSKRKFTTSYTEPPRHRRAWHELNNDERSLYIDGFNKLYEKGYLNDIIREHIVSFYNGQAHYVSGFFPWHRYYIYEFEQQIRDLGGRFEAFALPYWDWTHGVDNSDDDIFNILQQGLGGKSPSKDACITGSPFDNVRFINTESANEEECIIRNSCTQGTTDCTMESATELMSHILADPVLKQFRADFAYDQPGKHAYGHTIIAGGKPGTNNQQWAPLDPIFWLLHCYVDFIWTVWQNCHGYDVVDKATLTGNDNMYAPTDATKDGIDATLDFEALKVSWTHYTNQYSSKTIRDMWSNEDWDVSYDGTDFFDRTNAITNNKCNGHNINSNLFYTSSRRRRRLSGGANDTDDNNDSHLTKFRKFLNKNTNLDIKNRAKLLCIYDNMYYKRDNCPRPKYFEDCSDRNKYPLNKNGDIEISKKDLIEKVKDFPCMVKTREWLYDQAKMDGELLPLCNGWLDSFSMCDRDWITKYKSSPKPSPKSNAQKLPPLHPKTNDVVEFKKSVKNTGKIPEIIPSSNNIYTKRIFIPYEWILIGLSVLVNIIFIGLFCCNKNKNGNVGYGVVKYLSETEVESV